MVLGEVHWVYDKDGRIMKYGGDKGGIIAYFMINDQVYVQHGALFSWKRRNIS